MDFAHRPTVLVVEDQRDIREAIAYLLSEEGYEVAQASNGREALDCLGKITRPSVILLDLAMPDMGGEDFVAALRRDPVLGRIPVIVVSAAPTLEEKAIPPVFGGFFMKPFAVDELLAAVRRWAATSR
jgi:two-component system, OmpR family, response regulator VicR